VPEPARLLLIRHAQSEWNARGLWQGWADPPLTVEGLRQAGEAGRRLTSERFASVAASDLQRSRQTAAVISAALGLAGSVHIESDLREYDVGSWSGLTHPEIEAGWPGALEGWQNGTLESTPGGERRDRFVVRIAAAVARLGSSRADQRVLVVTHGGVIDALERTLGADRRPVPYLSGRWIEVSGGDLRPGPRLSALDPETNLQDSERQPAR
jgi:probable phosphoglycerate mutase